MRMMRTAIMGPSGAGKSTLIRRLDPKAVTIPEVNLGLYQGLVLWDASENRLYGRERLFSLDMNSSNEIWKVTLTELPGRFASSDLRRSMLRGRDGVIILVDATKPAHVAYALDQYREANEILGIVPKVILSNKHDFPTARDLKKAFSLAGVVEDVWEISALEGINVDWAFKSFLGKLRRYLMFGPILLPGDGADSKADEEWMEMDAKPRELRL